MTHLSSQTTIISFRIWAFSVLCITIVCVLILGGLTYDALLFLFFGLLIGGISSLPFLVFLVFAFTAIISKNYTWDKTIRKLVFIILIISIVSSILFYFMIEPVINEVLISFLTVLISGVISVFLQINYIKNICAIRDNEFIIKQQPSI